MVLVNAAHESTKLETTASRRSLPKMGNLEFPPLRSPRIVAIPIAFNEELKIGSVLDRFAGVEGVDIAVLDDGSTDRTPQIIVEKRAMLIQHAQRGGAGAAIRTAYRWARE